MSDNISDNSNDEPITEILVNECYGGFGVSNKAIDLYNKYKLEINPDFNPIKHYECLESIKDRSDPILIKVFDELGNEFNDKYSKAGKVSIKQKYIKHCCIREYDGKEYIDINYFKYKTDKLKEILYSENMDEIEKIKNMKILFETEKLSDFFW